MYVDKAVQLIGVPGNQPDTKFSELSLTPFDSSEFLRITNETKLAGLI